ncbi:MAG: hypothetical protein ACKOAI_07905 [Acidimicrobiia bacterium]
MTDLQTNEIMRVMATETPVESVDDFDAPASRGFVRYEIGKLRTEMIAGFAGLQDAMVKGDASLRQELRDLIGALRDEMVRGDASLRQELRDSIEALRDEMVKGDASLRQELGDEIVNGDASLRAEIHRLEVGLRQDMAAMHRSLLRWFVATQIATIGVVAALINSLGG